MARRDHAHSVQELSFLHFGNAIFVHLALLKAATVLSIGFGDDAIFLVACEAERSGLIRTGTFVNPLLQQTTFVLTSPLCLSVGSNICLSAIFVHSWVLNLPQ